jgi:hypothetical protein
LRFDSNLQVSARDCGMGSSYQTVIAIATARPVAVRRGRVFTQPRSILDIHGLSSADVALSDIAIDIYASGAINLDRSDLPSKVVYGNA